MAAFVVLLDDVGLPDDAAGGTLLLTRFRFLRAPGTNAIVVPAVPNLSTRLAGLFLFDGSGSSFCGEFSFGAPPVSVSFVALLSLDCAFFVDGKSPNRPPYIVNGS